MRRLSRRPGRRSRRALAAMLTKKAKYGLKALVFLAGIEPGQTALVADIATANQIPKKFLDVMLERFAQRRLRPLQEGQGRRLHAGERARVRDRRRQCDQNHRWPARAHSMRQQARLSALRRLRRRGSLRRAARHAAGARGDRQRARPDEAFRQHESGLGGNRGRARGRRERAANRPAPLRSGHGQRARRRL